MPLTWHETVLIPVVILKPLLRGVSTVEKIIKYATDVLVTEMNGPQMDRELRDVTCTVRSRTIE
jgi:hypothetical protein